MLYRDYLVEPLPLHNGARVLEIGVGDGETVAEVAGWFRAAGVRAGMIALDYDQGRGARLRSNVAAKGVGDMVHFVVGNAHALPLQGRSFDVVLCVNSLAGILLQDHGRTLRALDERRGQVIWPEVSPETVASWTRPLLKQFHDLLRPTGQLVVMDVEGDARDDDHARGVVLYARKNWPPLPSSLLDALLAEVGFVRVLKRTAATLSFADASEAQRWLGVPAGERQVIPPASIGPALTVSPEGACAFSIFLMQAFAA